MKKMTDLKTFADILGPYEAGRQLVNATRRVLGATSCLEDLNASFATLEVVSSIDTSGESDGHVIVGKSENIIIITSLFTHSLIQYCRATEADSDNRNGLDIRRKLVGSARSDHDRLTKLRNNAVAHYGDNASDMGGPWVKETCVYVEGPAEVIIKNAFLRRTISIDLANCLVRAIQEAAPIVQSLIEERIRIFERKLADLQGDARVADAWQRSEFDGIKFFGNRGSAERFASGRMQTRYIVGDEPLSSTSR